MVRLYEEGYRCHYTPYIMESNWLLRDFQPLKPLKNCDIRIILKRSANHNSWQTKKVSDD